MLFFFQFFNSPVALKNINKFWPPQEKVEMMPLVQVENAWFVSGIVVCCQCPLDCRSQEGCGIAQPWNTCFGTIWYKYVQGAPNTQDGDTSNGHASQFLTWQICHVQFCQAKQLGKWIQRAQNYHICRSGHTNLKIIFMLTYKNLIFSFNQIFLQF